MFVIHIGSKQGMSCYSAEAYKYWYLAHLISIIDIGSIEEMIRKSEDSTSALNTSKSKVFNSSGFTAVVEVDVYVNDEHM